MVPGRAGPDPSPSGDRRGGQATGGQGHPAYTGAACSQGGEVGGDIHGPRDLDAFGGVGANIATDADRASDPELLDESQGDEVSGIRLAGRPEIEGNAGRDLDRRAVEEDVAPRAAGGRGRQRVGGDAPPDLGEGPVVATGDHQLAQCRVDQTLGGVGRAKRDLEGADENRADRNPLPSSLVGPHEITVCAEPAARCVNVVEDGGREGAASAAAASFSTESSM